MADPAEAAARTWTPSNTPATSSGRGWRCAAWRASRLKVTPEELREYFERRYGPKVAARLIACSDSAGGGEGPGPGGRASGRFRRPRQALLGGRQQRQHRRPDPAHPPARRLQGNRTDGLLHGRRRGLAGHLRRRAIRDHQARERCCRPTRCGCEDVAPRLEEILREKKMRAVANEVFDELKKQAVIDVLMENPEKQRQLPGVAAVINGVQITVRQLAEECIARHGARRARRPDRPGTHRTGLPSSTTSRSARGRLTTRWRGWRRSCSAPCATARPTFQGFLKMVVEKEGISVAVYRHDAVWPSVALRKLVHDKIQITDEDTAKRLRGELRSAGAVPGDRGGPTPPCPAGLGNGPQAAHGRALRRSGRAVFHRGQQPLAARRGAAHRQAQRPADPGKRGLRLEAGRDVGRDPIGRQVRDPLLRGIHQAGEGGIRQGPRPDRRRHPREETASGHDRSTSTTCSRRPRSTTSSPARRQIARHAAAARIRRPAASRRLREVPARDAG